MTTKTLIVTAITAAFAATVTATPRTNGESFMARDSGANDIHDVNQLWLYVNIILNLGTYGFARPYSGNANYPGGAAEGSLAFGGPWVGTAAFGDPRVMNFFDTKARELDWSPRQSCVYWSDEPTWQNVPGFVAKYADLNSCLVCNDAGARQNRVGLAVIQHGMSWKDDLNRDFVLFKYYIYNRSGRDLDDVRVSFVYDLDMLGLSTSSDDHVDVDAARNMVYSYNDGPKPPYVGLRLVDGKATGGYAFEYRNFPTYDGARWQEMLKTEWKKTEYAADWVVVLNSGPYTVANDRRFSIGLAVVGGMSLAELQEHADAAHKKYWEIYSGLGEFTARGTPGGVLLTWVPDRPYAGYNLYRAEAEAVYAKVNRVRITGRPPLEYLDAGLPRARTYRYKLEGLTAAGQSEWFGPVEVELPAGRKTSFAVAGPCPNPARDRAVFSITLPAPAEVTFAAYDLSGRRETMPAEKWWWPAKPAEKRRVSRPKGGFASRFFYL